MISIPMQRLSIKIVSGMFGNDFFSYWPGRIIYQEIGDPEVFPVVKSINSLFQKLGHTCFFAAIESKGEVPIIRLKLDNKADSKPQGHSLTIGIHSFIQTAHDKPGLFYGFHTLTQIVGFVLSSVEWPILQISDWHGFERKGIMLDVNKDQVSHNGYFI